MKHEIAVALLAVLVLSGCASLRSGPGDDVVVIPYTDEELMLREEARDASYSLRVGDQFGVVFKYEPDLNQRTIKVLPDGKVTLAGAEGIHAAGLTLEELDAKLTAAFSEDYKHPDLSVIIEELSGNHVYVLGEVQQPGLVTLPPGGTGVLQAIAEAGGFTDDASSSETVVIRLTEEGYQYRRCDIDNLEKGGVGGSYIMDLQPYDVIYVPRGFMGDLANFNRTVLSSVLNISRLYWEYYAIVNLDKVDRILR